MKTAWDEVKDLETGAEARVETDDGFVTGVVLTKDATRRMIAFQSIGRANPEDAESGSVVIVRTVVFPADSPAAPPAPELPKADE